MDSFERKEIKYLLTPLQYERLLALVAGHVAPAEFPEGDVNSIYYDTPDDLLINRSINGGTFKEKLRVRSYGTAAEGSKVYVEIKKKLKGVVYKRRLACSLEAAQAFLAGMDYERAIERWPLALADDREESRSFTALQIAKEVAWMRDRFGNLAPKMQVSVHRTSFVGVDDPDLRITFDHDARWDARPTLDATKARHTLFDGKTVILEAKSAQALPVWLAEAISACGIRPQSVSKYGRAYQAAMALDPRAPRPAVAAPVFTPGRQAATVPVRRNSAHRIPKHAPAAAVAPRKRAASKAVLAGYLGGLLPHRATA